MKKNNATENLTCPICGEITSSYMGNYRKDKLCRKHALQLKNGNIKIQITDDDSQTLFLDSNSGEVLNLNYNKNTTPTYTELPTTGFNKCVICERETIGYAFCWTCYHAHTENELLDILNNTDTIENEEDNDTDEEEIETFSNNNEQNKTVVIDSNNKSKCITCGKQTDGLLFCTTCYHKYKNKELHFRITNCTNVELLDEDYESKITCKDGHIVKSKAEYMIDDYLYGHNIIHAYEKGLPYGATEKEVLHPDFYLPNYLGEGKHVYIEYWGFNENNIQYTNTKKFKLDIYRKKHVTLISVSEKDTYDIETSLDRKLNKEYIREGEINE